MKISLSKTTIKNLCDIAPNWKHRIINPEDNLVLTVISENDGKDQRPLTAQPPKDCEPYPIRFSNEDKNKHILQISNPQRCIVGEAWGFDAGYSVYGWSRNGKIKQCTKCNFYSMVMYDSITGILKKKIEASEGTLNAYNVREEFDKFVSRMPLEKYLIEFIKHFKSQHYNNRKQKSIVSEKIHNRLDKKPTKTIRSRKNKKNISR